MPHLLEADSVQLEFDLRKVLSDVYIRCETGRITGLLGRNGEGKTCLMNIIYGSLPALSKSIRFDHTSVPEAFRRPDLLLYLPQFRFIPPSLTLKRIFRDFDLDYSPFEKLFPGFSSCYRTRIRDLHGTQRRIVEVYVIARAKALFSLLDEPFTHLMPLQVEKIKEVLTLEKQHKGLLITDHLFRQITDISDDLYVLRDGKTYLTKSITDIETLGYARL